MSNAHIHLLVYAKWQPTAKPLDEPTMADWLVRLVKTLNMNILFGPVIKVSDNPGNEGITGVISIDTSHIAFHDWGMHDPAYFQLDVYTCGALSSEVVVNALKEFEFREISWMLIDRALHFNADEFKVLETGNVVL